VKTKCPHSGLRDLRDCRSGAEAPRPKRKRRRKKVAVRAALEPAFSNAASGRDATPPADDIERESVPEPEWTERDIERE
jgi:hypothetical protein